jgi:hypothetical protein
MRSTPPAVEVTLAPGRREQWLVAAAHAMAVSFLGAWLAEHAGAPVVAAWALAGVVGAWLGLKVLQPMVGALRWDGECWWHLPYAEGAHPLHRVDLMMDLGGWVLLRARAERGQRRLLPGHWCGISRRDAGHGWHGLRLALYQGAAGGLPSVAVPADRTSG